MRLTSEARASHPERAWWGPVLSLQDGVQLVTMALDLPKMPRPPAGRGAHFSDLTMSGPYPHRGTGLDHALRPCVRSSCSDQPMGGAARRPLGVGGGPCALSTHSSSTCGHLPSVCWNLVRPAVFLHSLYWFVFPESSCRNFVNWFQNSKREWSWSAEWLSS